MAKVTPELIAMDIQRSTGEIRAMLNQMMLRANSEAARNALERMYTALETAPRGSVIEVLDVDRIIKKVLNDYLTKFLASENSSIDDATCEFILKLFTKRSAMCAVGMSSSMNRRAAFKQYKKTHRAYNRKQMKENFKLDCEMSDEIIQDSKDIVAKLTGERSFYQLTAMRHEQEAQLAEQNEKLDKLKAQFKAAKDTATKQRLESEFKSLQVTMSRINKTLISIINTTGQMSQQVDFEAQIDYYNQIQAISTYDPEKTRTALKAIQKQNKQEAQLLEESQLMGDTYLSANASFMDTAARNTTGGLEALVAREEAQAFDAYSAGSLSDLIESEDSVGDIGVGTK